MEAHAIVEESLFAAADEQFDALKTRLQAPATWTMEHSEVEDLIETEGREVMRQLMQSHLTLRAEQEQREGKLDEVVGADGRRADPSAQYRARVGDAVWARAPGTDQLPRARTRRPAADGRRAQLAGRAVLARGASARGPGSGARLVRRRGGGAAPHNRRPDRQAAGGAARRPCRRRLRGVLPHAREGLAAGRGDVGPSAGRDLRRQGDRDAPRAPARRDAQKPHRRAPTSSASG